MTKLDTELKEDPVRTTQLFLVWSERYQIYVEWVISDL